MPDQPAPPRFDPESEVRLALVMYGGVSLAIYMNGVSQELLRAVRATAPRRRADSSGGDDDYALLSDSELDSTERIYRRIAQHLSAGRWDPATFGAESSDAPIRCRLLIDIISGTSAGGINGVFLAKALATGESIDRLANLWVEEGAIERLINDAGSRFDRTPAPKHPTSLLNSRRMYRKLVDAFDDMDADAAGTPTTPLAHQVDLFVTTTDIAGLPIALRLSDRVVAERRHRNVFHLRYDDEADGATCNHFLAEFNPFLAYISRCTSSFPIAFEPMTLADIDSVLEARGARSVAQPVPRDGGRWRQFFPAYTGSGEEGRSTNDSNIAEERFESAEPWLRDGGPAISQRAFGDGGYLDNKPFEYAIGALAGRRASLPSQRKLLYVEPSPEHPELDPLPTERPNPVENLSAALGLARYETIRTDLERVLTRNRLVERVGRIVKGVDADMALHDKQRLARETANGGAQEKPYDPREYPKLDLAALIDQFGIAYGGYHRLKISALTDEIAEYVARVSRFNEQSDEFQAVRHIVAAWRDRKFAPYLGGPGTEGKESENALSLKFDLSFRIRRLTFVLARCDLVLGASDEELAELLEHRGLALDNGAESRAAFENAVREVRNALSPLARQLRDLRLALLARDATINPIGEAVATLKINRAEMLAILDPPTIDERVRAAAALLDKRNLWPSMDAVAARLSEVIGAKTIPASAKCNHVVPPPPITTPSPTDPAAVATTLLRWYYWDYERYDQLIFPTFFSTEVGEETSVVDVLRVSPEDAPSLIPEGATSERRRKLAGNSLMHFGAFLDRRWRWNDIMWGRLDGAERLITCFLAGAGEDRRALRQSLIDEAHGAILEDELRKPEAEPFTWATTAEQQEIQQLLTMPSDAPIADRLAARERVRRIFKRSYRTPDDPPPQAMAEAAARSARVIGGMLDGMTERYTLLKQPAAWLTRVASIAWGVVEIAAPQSMRNIVANHAFKLLYTLEALLIAVGTFFSPTIWKFGIETLLLTLGGHGLILLVRDLFSRRTAWLRRVVAIVALAMATALIAGGFAIYDGELRKTLIDHVVAPGGPVRFTLTLIGVFVVLRVVLVIGAMKVWRFLGGTPRSADASTERGAGASAARGVKTGKGGPPGGGTSGALRGVDYDRRRGGVDTMAPARDRQGQAQKS